MNYHELANDLLFALRWGGMNKESIELQLIMAYHSGLQDAQQKAADKIDNILGD
jgi:hypothetical protein